MVAWWFDVLLFNVAGAAVLAGVATLAGRRWPHRPALVHALWVLVMVKLVSFPLIELRWIPRPHTGPVASAMLGAPAREPDALHPDDRGSVSSSMVRSSETPTAEGTARDQAPAGAPSGSLQQRLASWASASGAMTLPVRSSWLAGFAVLALLGSAVVLLRGARSAWRLRCLTRNAKSAPPRVRERLVTLGQRLGIPARSLPHVRWLRAAVAPAAWAPGRRAEILLPAPLVSQLTARELDALLAHELAHVRRRDPWLRWLEAVVTAMHWWNPILWWARRNVRVAEERACDGLVMQVLPQHTRDYARALVRTVEFLAQRTAMTPALATGAGVGAGHRLEERVTMILNARPVRGLSGLTRNALYAAALIALCVSPAWVGISESIAAGPRKDGQDTARRVREALIDVARAEGPVPEAVMRKHEMAMTQLERETLEIERAMRELELKRMRVEQQLHEAEVAQERERLQHELQSLRQAGHEAEARETLRELERLETEVARFRQQVEFQRRYATKLAALEFEMRELDVQRREHEIRGDLEAVEKVQSRMMALEHDIKQLEVDRMREELRLTREELERRSKELEASAPTAK